MTENENNKETTMTTTPTVQATRAELLTLREELVRTRDELDGALDEIDRLRVDLLEARAKERSFRTSFHSLRETVGAHLEAHCTTANTTTDQEN